MERKMDWGLNEEIPLGKEEAKELLEKANKLYDEGKWDEAIKILEEKMIPPFPFIGEDLAEAYRIVGWSYYYLGIKGSEDKKIENLKKAEDAFNICLEKAEDKTKISAMNGLPLALWILGKKEEAWQVSYLAVEKFPDIPSTWNTRSILCRWAGDYKKAIEVCQKVYETARDIGDYRTAGHGKHNQGDAFVRLGEKVKAQDAYQEAQGMYIKDGKSDFHLEAARKKAQELKIADR